MPGETMVSEGKRVAERFVWWKTAMAPRAVLRVAKKVSAFLTSNHTPHALAGGMAVGIYGFNRMTRDVDFVVSESARKVIEQLGPTTVISGHLDGVSVKVDGVDVDFLFVSKTVHQGDLSSVKQFSGIPVIGIDPLVAMKMGAGRHKDTLDVVELLKLGNVSVEEVEKRLSGEDLEQFQGFVTIADLEKKGEHKQGRKILMAMLSKSAGENR
jgi:hypothetical protein